MAALTKPRGEIERLRMAASELYRLGDRPKCSRADRREYWRVADQLTAQALLLELAARVAAHSRRRALAH